ncbi:hypothetical protein NXV08_00195 (plasmid) [Bacteroides fragilis]|nr:hypothetical protein [Bacteroides fragilis]
MEKQPKKIEKFDPNKVVHITRALRSKRLPLAYVYLRLFRLLFALAQTVEYAEEDLFPELDSTNR